MMFTFMMDNDNDFSGWEQYNVILTFSPAYKAASSSRGQLKNIIDVMFCNSKDVRDVTNMYHSEDTCNVWSSLIN